MRLVMHLKLAIDRFKCSIAFVFDGYDL